MPNQQYLFLFTIGPVQSFIAQARKTRDLYASSAILGEIIDAAISQVKGMHENNTIIVPDPDLQAKPNRLLARITSDDLLSFGKQIEQAARAKWMTIALNAFIDARICKDILPIGFEELQTRIFEHEALAYVKPV